MSPVRIEPLDSESDALQLCHRDPNPHMYTSLWTHYDEAIGFNSSLDIKSPVVMTLLKASVNLRLRQVDAVSLKSTYDLHQVDTIFDRIRAVQQRTCTQLCRNCQ